MICSYFCSNLFGNQSFIYFLRFKDLLFYLGRMLFMKQLATHHCKGTYIFVLFYKTEFTLKR